MKRVNLHKACGPKSHAWPRFYLIPREIMKSIDLPKACGPRGQAWPRFCLIFTQAVNATHKVITENLAELPFINNSTFTSYLHSRVVAQLLHLGPLGSMHLCPLPR